MALDNNWFSEIHEKDGSAFSLKVTKKLEEVQSEFQLIEVYQTENFGKLMVIDGFVMLTSRDNFLYHEMMTHPAMFTHPNPKRVLVIGGGDCGTLREVLNHPSVELAQQVEIDEQVTRLSEKHFPELCEKNSDPRAELHFVDGLKWVKDAQAGFYDLIIVDSTDPIGPAEGLFTEVFYRDCYKALGDNGLIVQQSESPLYHMKLIKEMHQAMRSAGYLDVLTLNFPQPVYPSGWWSATMACKDSVVSGFREQAVEDRPFSTRYYNSAIHRASMAAPQFFVEEMLGGK